MERRKLYVSPSGDRWKVHEGGSKVHGYFHTQGNAINFARRFLSKFRAGMLSQILVQRPDGRFRTEWTYGSDPFPPVG